MPLFRFLPWSACLQNWVHIAGQSRIWPFLPTSAPHHFLVQMLPFLMEPGCPVLTPASKLELPPAGDTSTPTFSSCLVRAYPLFRSPLLVNSLNSCFPAAVTVDTLSLSCHPHTALDCHHLHQEVIFLSLLALPLTTICRYLMKTPDRSPSFYNHLATGAQLRNVKVHY